MTDEHAKLAAEYKRLLTEIEHTSANPDEVSAGFALRLVIASCRHILRRLGPPDAGEAADIATDDEMFRD